MSVMLLPCQFMRCMDPAVAREVRCQYTRPMQQADGANCEACGSVTFVADMSGSEWSCSWDKRMIPLTCAAPCSPCFQAVHAHELPG